MYCTIKNRFKCRFNEALQNEFPEFNKTERESVIHCTVCDKTISIINKGKHDIVQHMSSKTHQKKLNKPVTENVVDILVGRTLSDSAGEYMMPPEITCALQQETVEVEDIKPILEDNPLNIEELINNNVDATSTPIHEKASKRKTPAKQITPGKRFRSHDVVHISNNVPTPDATMHSNNMDTHYLNELKLEIEQKRLEVLKEEMSANRKLYAAKLRLLQEEQTQQERVYQAKLEAQEAKKAYYMAKRKNIQLIE